jgi:TRAP-type C4-dicarboxylate transport system substrate-binding protein
MRKTVFFLPIVFLVACLLFGPNSHEVLAQSNELKFQSPYPPAHVTVKKAFEPWFDTLAQKSDGNLKVIFFPPRAIVKENETFEGAEAGLVDIGASMCGRNPGKFPLHSIAELPLLFPSSAVGSQVVWRTLKQFPEMQREFKGVNPLWQWTSATAQIMTTKKQVKTLEDLKGLKIIGYTPMMLETIKALGGNPLQISPLDAYLSLERGMADGIIMSYAGGRSLKLHESCKYIAEIDVLTITFYAVMSPMTYGGLSANLKKVIDGTTGLEMSRACGLALDNGSQEAAKWLREQGTEIYVVPQDERERWLAAVKPVYESHIKKLENQGLKKAAAILEMTTNLTRELSAQ